MISSSLPAQLSNFMNYKDILKVYVGLMIRWTSLWGEKVRGIHNHYSLLFTNFCIIWEKNIRKYFKIFFFNVFHFSTLPSNKQTHKNSSSSHLLKVSFCPLISLVQIYRVWASWSKFTWCQLEKLLMFIVKGIDHTFFFVLLSLF